MNRGDFWSRRRAAVEAEEAAEARAGEEARVEGERARLRGKSDEEVLAELGLPDPETITSGEDVRAFMARVVPEHLRRRALRKLWRTDPALACLDGLVDYAEDYADAATVQPDLRSAYRVGKGMVRQIERLAGEDPVAPAGDAPVEIAAPESAVEPGPDPTPVAEEHPDEAPDWRLNPRRMAFRFGEET